MKENNKTKKGNVGYTPVLHNINTTLGQQDASKKCKSYGKLEGISEIISLIQGYHIVLARKADGTVINLSDTFKSTGYFK